MGAHLTGGRA